MIKEYIRNLLALQQEGRPLRDVISELQLFRFVVIATEWGAMKGGVSTFNANLCRALASLGHSVLVAIVQEPTAETINAPPTYDGVGDLRFTVVDSVPTGDRLDEIRAFGPDFVVGHDRFTGPSAITVTSLIGNSTKSMLFIHVDPLIELSKNSPSSDRVRTREKRERWQKSLIKNADVVVSVGPRLGQHTETIISELRAGDAPLLHVTFIPGLDERLSEQSRNLDGSTFRIGTFGRLEDAEVKGQDVFNDAVEILALSEFGRIVQPFSLGGSYDDVWEAYQSPNVSSYLDWRSYSGDQEEVQGRIRSAHVLVMPSREEGFGLVALEAIAANRPVVASSNSGFAEWLKSIVERELPELREMLRFFIVDFRIQRAGSGSDRSILAQRLAAALEQAYREYPTIVDATRILRHHLKSYGWPKRCDDLSRQLRSITKADASLDRI